MSIVTAKVQQIEKVNHFVSKVTLKTEQEIDYQAGQYAQVVVKEGDHRPFSIATPAGQKHVFELHIGASEQNPYAQEVMNLLSSCESVDIEVGCGSAYWRPSPEPVILLAGGTGYSYARSILLTALQSESDTPIYLYWGAKTLADLYEHEQLVSLDSQHLNFHYIPVLEAPDSNWTGCTGFVHEQVIADFKQFSNQNVYVAGRFEMAKVVKASFVAHNLTEAQLFGDAFAFID